MAPSPWLSKKSQRRERAITRGATLGRQPQPISFPAVRVRSWSSRRHWRINVYVDRKHHIDEVHAII